MKSHAIKLLALLCTLLLMLSIGGVSAAWYYDQDEITPVIHELSVEFFPWKGSEVLPEDGNIGENHLKLIDAIINNETLGLNAASSELNASITDRWTSTSSFWDPKKNTVGSMSRWDGGNLDNLFGTETSGLEFLLEFIDDDKDGKIDYYYLYTTNIKLTYDTDVWHQNYTPNIPYGKNVTYVFRTKVEKNNYDVWAATDSKLGYATSQKYDAGTVVGGLASIPSFGYGNNWHEITPETIFGDSFTNPLWTHRGLANSVSVDTDKTVAYYAIQSVDNGIYTATPASSKCVITIYGASQNVITTSDKGQAVSWSVTEGTQYFITITGDTTLEYVISLQ